MKGRTLDKVGTVVDRSDGRHGQVCEVITVARVIWDDGDVGLYERGSYESGYYEKVSSCAKWTFGHHI